jgi:ABC transporter substrate binding protein (PQQ-dependent alcohol dehydrogenase system)
MERNSMILRKPAFIALVAVLLVAPLSVRAETLKISIGYIFQEEEPHIPLSFLEPERMDTGLGGARLAIKDNNTTGRFMGQAFELVEQKVPIGGDVKEAFRKLVAAQVGFIVLNLTKSAILDIVDLPEAQGLLFFNAREKDDALREQACRRNLFHTAPSRAMLADALAQYLVWKRWKEWFLVAGKTPEDKAFSDAVKRSAKRFGAKIVAEKPWTFDAGARRTDSGHHSAQTEIPTFTQGEDYDVLVVADEADEFGEYLSHRTSLPRPVAGTQGLVPAIWHRSNEQWGATQFHNRFERMFAVRMTPRDYGAWAAVRTIGEAATRTKSKDVKKLRDYVLSDEFTLAGFKGKAVSYRSWNGQMRQPILISGPRMLVSVSPQAGFLHPVSDLDTLGFDAPETKCVAYNL